MLSILKAMRVRSSRVYCLALQYYYANVMLEDLKQAVNFLIPMHLINGESDTLELRQTLRYRLSVFEAVTLVSGAFGVMMWYKIINDGVPKIIPKDRGDTCTHHIVLPDDDQAF